MDTITVVQGVFRAGMKLLNAAKLSREISGLRESIYKAYFDYSKAHFDSALEAIHMAETSKAPEMELRHGVHHLYDAYFVLYELLDRTVKQRILRKSSWSYVEYREDIYVPCCRIAGLTSRLYSFLGETKNAEKWNCHAREMQEKACPIYKEILQYYKKLPYRLEDTVKFMNLGYPIFSQQQAVEVALRARFSEETRKREISKEYYVRLRRIDPDYISCKKVNIPKLGMTANIERYCFYFMTEDGVKYINKTLQSMKQAIVLDKD